MKHKLFYLLMAGFLLGCSPAEKPAEEAVQAPAEEAAQAVADSADNGPDLYQEYLWCTSGSNRTDEKVQALTEDWLRLSEEAGLPEFGAMVLNPRVQVPNFDTILGLIWSSKEARDSGMASYEAAGVQAKLDERHPGVNNCGGENSESIFGFDVWQSDPPSAKWDQEANPSALGQYQFCTYNEGKEPADLISVIQGPYSDWLSNYEKENGPSSYSYKYFRPDFDTASAQRTEAVPEQYDFMWVNFWTNPAEQKAGQEAFAKTGQDIQAALDAVAACGDPISHDVVSIRNLPRASS
ncbi:MAG TPA: hypothetical protein QF611_07230 [Pseudomonadales bacterium]|jgi:hypothetical protein|nr:hypothetical protein [Pseudomonadales bacterium]MDP7452662.1 hypothetical protein [Arenicellales bacterium]HJP50804.1 hypothetical protein [Pseudomonadales bacterium]|tara:strand:- start:2518 stop:3402 length:885 start_codon:yes stop_codon:yes gene_type:complete